MKRKELEEIVRDAVKEMSTISGTANATAGTGEQTFEPLNRKRPKLEAKDKETKLAAGKVKDNYAVSHFGYKEAPHKANRKSGMIDYKQLFEDQPIDETLLTSVSKKLDKLRDDYPEIYEKIINQILKYVIELEPYDKEIQQVVDTELKAANIDLAENYSRFRSQTGKRSGPEQLHTAVKEIKKKLSEVDRLLEYTEKLRSEITEGSEGFKYKVHTERALEQITEMIKHTYMKSKNLRQHGR